MHKKKQKLYESYLDWQNFRCLPPVASIFLRTAHVHTYITEASRMRSHTLAARSTPIQVGGTTGHQ